MADCTVLAHGLLALLAAQKNPVTYASLVHYNIHTAYKPRSAVPPSGWREARQRQRQDLIGADWRLERHAGVTRWRWSTNGGVETRFEARRR